MKTTKMLTILVLVLGLVGNASAGLVAHYEFAADFNDSSGNGLHGVPMGGASIISDPERGDVLSLGGAGQYVDCGNNALFDITEAITVAGWIKVNAFDVEWQAVVAKGNSAWRLHRNSNTNSLAFHCSGLSAGWGTGGSVNVNDGEWHHVVGVYDGSKIYLYVDGVVDNSEPTSGIIDSNPEHVFIGGNSQQPGREWNGLIDDVRIYNHALSPAEIAGLAGKIGTAFTYQGRLLDADSPADGLYDLEFKLYDDPNSGTQQGSTITIGQLDIIDGYFTVELDFGSGVFNGNSRWVEIGVRPGELNDPNAYTILSPRQIITPTPYALYAKTAGGDSDWMVSGNNMYAIPSGNVGIGTTSPGYKLSIMEGDIEVEKVAFYANTGPYIKFKEMNFNDVAGIFFKANGAGNSNQLRFTVGANNEDPPDQTQAMVIEQGGNVGFGTTNPQGVVDVNGPIYQRGSVLSADYVFEPGYELESIDEHSRYMWDNKHLRAIPEKSIDENGQEIIEVGAHRKGIVEELEKAHIYIDQLHKRNKVLEERLAKLEAMVAKMNVSLEGEMK